jgi:2'-5' RNA ligase
MPPLQYALVSYVESPIGRFVEELRHELSPEEGHHPAHITVLPPRTLTVPENDALSVIEEVCRPVVPFEVTLGDVETFMPRTGTVFIRVAHAAYRMRELHDQLNTNGLEFAEPFPYMPHLTIFKMEDLSRVRRAMLEARQRWDDYRGDRTIWVERLNFVRGTLQAGWQDLATVQLGGRLAGVPL